MKTGAAQPATSTPASDRGGPQLTTSTAGAVLEAEQNTLRAQIPAQVRGHRDERACFTPQGGPDGRGPGREASSGCSNVNPVLTVNQNSLKQPELV